MAVAHAQTAIKKAVYRQVPSKRQALLDRLFALWFARFVYNQIWEDPVVDLDALELGPGHRVVTIASGGCNILNYLTADPAAIDAVDLNPAHIALTRLKLAAMRHLPGYEAFFQFFGIAKNKENVELYWSRLADRLDPATRKFWEHRSLLGRPRIDFFAKGLYRKALLGKFIGFLHAFARLADRKPAKLLAATSLDEQRQIYRREIEPLFEMKLVRLLCRQPVLLYSLGIPAAQFDQMKQDSAGDLATLYQDRIRRLACDFSLDENYFAWQAFGRHYDVKHRRATPAYLQSENFLPIRERLDRVRTHTISMTEYLAGQEECSVDRYVLLDSVDWMDAAMLSDLWQQIRRTARPGARVIFRTAGARSPLENDLAPELLDGWRYHEAASRRYLEQDRSAIYGGFHLYVRTE
ncbi:MAG: S-adenosylmethionine-diacylglycerol 3-amino-3-carboxypropyl transferase [Aliidongia sp.]|jgi:S-adenosylmethionine-diacylglycerol 3-amino-3-carboxypropyl transferase|nr:S-adenosylmethionine-diacylglycerol 3-amino-3-carboxypropyl transferase [Aliidongia sp.]